jgi:hypothetical protein
MKIFTVFADFFRYIFRVEATSEQDARDTAKRIVKGNIDRVVEGDVYNDYKIVDNKIVRK